MSGRRRRGDGWDEGRRDAHDDRRDPWSDGSVDDWTGRDRRRGEAADRPDSSAGSAAGRGARDGYRPAGGTQASGRERAGYDNLRYDAGSGYGGQRDAGNGYTAAGYNGNGYAEPGYPAARHGGQRDLPGLRIYQ